MSGSASWIPRPRHVRLLWVLSGAADTRPRSRHADAEQLAVESDLPAGGLRPLVVRGRLRRQLRLRPAEDPRRQPGPQRDVNRNGRDDRNEYILTNDAALRQFGVFGNNNIGIWDHTGESTYHSLQSQFVSRFGRGSQFQAHTLSRSRANFAMTDSGQLAANTTRLDNQNTDLDWGVRRLGEPTSSTRRSSGCCPRSRAASPLMRTFLGDWEIAGILGAGTGQPLTAYTGGLGSGLTGGPSGTGFTDNQRPNRVSGEPCRASSGPDEQIINPRAYTLDGFRLGTIGTAERGDCTGPGYFQTDLAFYKNFPLKNGVKVQFRWTSSTSSTTRTSCSRTST